MHVVGVVIANPEAQQPLELTARTFDDPTNLSKAAAVIDASACNDGRDPLGAKALPDGLTVVASVRVNHAAVLPWPPGFGANLRDAFDHWQDQFLITGVRRGSVGHERHTVGFDQQRALRSEFPVVNSLAPSHRCRRMPAPRSYRQLPVRLQGRPPSEGSSGSRGAIAPTSHVRANAKGGDGSFVPSSRVPTEHPPIAIRSRARTRSP